MERWPKFFRGVLAEGLVQLVDRHLQPVYRDKLAFPAFANLMFGLLAWPGVVVPELSSFVFPFFGELVAPRPETEFRDKEPANSTVLL